MRTVGDLVLTLTAEATSGPNPRAELTIDASPDPFRSGACLSVKGGTKQNAQRRILDDESCRK